MLRSWKTTIAGSVPALLLFLQSWLNNNHRLDWRDPALLVGIGLALVGAVSKDYNISGGGDPPKGTTS